MRAFTLPVRSFRFTLPYEVLHSMEVCRGVVIWKLMPIERLFLSFGLSVFIVRVVPSGTKYIFICSAISLASVSVGAWTVMLAITLQSATSAPWAVIEP